MKHYFAIFGSRCAFIKYLKYYFQFNSEIRINIENLFKNHYDFENLLANDMDAVLARIDFVERNEPRSSYAVA